MEVFLQISLILLVATIMAAIMQLLRQPVIIGHIISAIIVGPAGFGWVHLSDTIELFSEIGIALLLFIIGLGLNPRVLREVSSAALLTGLGQISFTGILGFAIATALNFSHIEALYIAAALTLSSTIVAVKLISDKKDSHRLYGKLTTGFLLVQDIVAVLLLIVVSATAQQVSVQQLVLTTVAGAVATAVILALVAHYLLPRLSSFFAKSQEQLFGFAITWALGMASLAYILGFAIEIGALAAGVALAASPYAYEISSRLRPLRDFFIILFFYDLLGASLELSAIVASIVPAIILSLFILLGNPLIVMGILSRLHFTRKTSFQTALSVAQIGEFSLILIILARDVGHISSDIVTLVTLVALFTIVVSSYMILYSERLYEWFAPYLQFFERGSRRQEQELSTRYDAVIFGFKAGSRSFLDSLDKLGKRYVVVDYDPQVVEMLSREGTPAIYGDIQDTEFLQELALESIELAIITASDFGANIMVVEHMMQCNPEAIVIAKAEESYEAQDLYDLGASYVMMSHFLGSIEISRRVARYGINAQEHFSRIRRKHIDYLQKSPK